MLDSKRWTKIFNSLFYNLADKYVLCNLSDNGNNSESAQILNTVFIAKILLKYFFLNF